MCCRRSTRSSVTWTITCHAHIAQGTLMQTCPINGNHEGQAQPQSANGHRMAIEELPQGCSRVWSASGISYVSISTLLSYSLSLKRIIQFVPQDFPVKTILCCSHYVFTTSELCIHDMSIFFLSAVALLRMATCAPRRV